MTAQSRPKLGETDLQGHGNTFFTPRTC